MMLFAWSRWDRWHVGQNLRSDADWCGARARRILGIASISPGIAPRSGRNALRPVSSATALRLFLRQFESPLLLILIFAAVAAAALRQWTDASARAIGKSSKRLPPAYIIATTAPARVSPSTSATDVETSATASTPIRPSLRDAGRPEVPREFSVVPQHQVIPSSVLAEYLISFTALIVLLSMSLGRRPLCAKHRRLPHLDARRFVFSAPGIFIFPLGAPGS